MVGEISFFLKTRRTATIVCGSTVRLFYLDVRYKKKLLELCPLLYRRMRTQIYKYKDECIEYKINLIKGGVNYLQNVEREALLELAFQMKISAYKGDDPVVKTLEKINALFIIFDGML